MMLEYRSYEIAWQDRFHIYRFTPLLWVYPHCLIWRVVSWHVDPAT